MERGVAAGGCAKQSIAIAIHALGTHVDALISDPRRIADDDVETAARHHMREVDVVREEIELTVLRALQQTTRLDDARVQLAAARDVERTHAAEEILLRRRQLLQLAIIDLDRLSEQFRREPLVVAADQPRERRPFPRRRTAITDDEIGLGTNGGQPLAINVAAAVAEKIDRAEQRVPLQD